jgi:tripartite-type tricarboxylate transporter receptor subunit TctC
MTASTRAFVRIPRLLGAFSMMFGIIVFAGKQASAQQTVEQFYKGRTITMRVPSASGGINDIVGRLVARYLQEYIPGHPAVIVQNLPSGGGLTSANILYNTAERDGTVIGFLERGTAQTAMQGDPNAKFDPLKMTWLGSLSSYANDAYMLVVNASSPFRSVEDLRGQGRVLKIGSQHAVATNTQFAMIAKLVLGLNIDVVRGYTGAAPMFLAMQQGEIEGQVIGLSALRAVQPHLWNDKLVRPLIQFARNTRLPEIKDVPTGQELAPDAAARTLLEYAETPFHMALPFVAPPQLPPDRARALQTAFMAVMKDKEFIAAAEKLNQDVSPIDGDAVRDVLARSASVPKEVIARFTDVTTATPAR